MNKDKFYPCLTQIQTDFPLGYLKTIVVCGLLYFLLKHTSH